MARKATPKRKINGKDYYYKKVTIGYDPVTNKPIRKDFYAYSATELNNKIDKFFSLYKQNISPNNKETFGNFMYYWLKDVHFNSGLKNSTKQRYLGIYNNYIANIESFLNLKEHNSIEINKLLIKNIQLISIDTRCIQEYYTSLKNIGVSIHTIQSINKLIKPCLTHAYNSNKCSRDFGIGLIPPKLSFDEKVLLDSINESKSVFTLEEQNKFLNAIKGNRDEVLYRVAFSTGLRLGELLALKWSCIDFDNCTININKSVRRETNLETGVSYLTETTLKTQNSYELLDMPSFLISDLKKHQKSQQLEKIKAGNMYEDNNLVFCTALGKITDPRNLRKRYNTILKKAGIPHKKFHAIRHTFATRLIESGKPLIEVKFLMRHKHLSTTADIYTHLTKCYKERISNTITL